MAIVGVPEARSNDQTDIPEKSFEA